MRAPLKPPMLKLTSFIAAKEHPATIGRSERYVIAEKDSPMKTDVKITENTGSAALTTCVNDTAILEKDTQADTWATVWNRATGARLNMSFGDTFGTGWSLRSHIPAIQITPEANWIVESSQGFGNMFSVLLFKMLKMMLKAYHKAK
mmetsp:Transcript_2608/g.6131  ORF Transcript_2608/g.6131 Transcript_2608/m.6131 type:complete len:147 (+) Transcript_2608:747-1187(+)